MRSQRENRLHQRGRRGGDAVKSGLPIVLAVPLLGCSVSDPDVARRCGLDEIQLNAAFDEVARLSPSQSRTIGRCTFTRGVGQQRVVVVITKSGRLGAPQ